MLQQATDIVHSCLADLSIALLVPEQITVTLPQALVGMHAGAVVAEDWLRHEGGGFAVPPGDVADDVFVIHDAVGHFRQRPEPHVYFALAGGAHLVVMDL